MIVITGGRQQGKTEAIVRWLHEDPQRRCVLVADLDRKRYILGRLHVGSLRGFPWKDHVVVASNFMFGGYMRGHARPFHFPEVAVDDMEDVFKVVFGATLAFATMTATWIPLGPQEPIKAEVIDDTMIEGGEDWHIGYEKTGP